MDKKSVLITGVCGLLGSQLSDWIIENKKEYEVVGIDSLFGGYIENISKDVIFISDDMSMAGADNIATSPCDILIISHKTVDEIEQIPVKKININEID